MKVNLLMAGKYIFVFIFGIICGLFISQARIDEVVEKHKKFNLQIISIFSKFN